MAVARSQAGSGICCRNPVITLGGASPSYTASMASPFECEVRYTHNGGDHVIFVGEVRRMAFDPAREPLIYYRGRYTSLAGEGDG